MEEQKADERTAEQLNAEYEAIQQAASELASKIVKIFSGAPQSGRLQRCAGLSLENLEACMHRMNDGMHFLMQGSVTGREAVAQQGLAKGPGMHVVNGGK